MSLAEVNASPDDAGNYQSSGGAWSDVFAYDNRSNLTSRKDARGVKTVYNYGGDPLNRLQTVSSDTSHFGDSKNPLFRPVGRPCWISLTTTLDLTANAPAN
ncbi:MAG: hypothetical protein DMF74_21740 [Acidobacteria bacterium]|nr:MAG: hypothetical protein DMF74_21740 [Acidobacteriota bacterium]